MFQGSAMRSRQYFKKIGHPLPAFCNPADAYLRILQVSYPKTAEDVLRIEGFVDNYENIIKPMVDRQMEELQFVQLASGLAKERAGANVCVQFYQLFLRNAIGLARNPAALIGRIVISIFVSITSLALFWGYGNKLKDTDKDPVQVMADAFGLASSIFFMCIAQLSLYEFATVMEF